MSQETTNPNGSRKKASIEQESSEEIEKRMQEAGYHFCANYMEAQFSVEKVKDSNGNPAGDTTDTNKAGEYTITGTSGSMSFIQKTPDIAQGPSAPLRTNKEKRKSEKNSEKQEKTDEKGQETEQGKQDR